MSNIQPTYASVGQWHWSVNHTQDVTQYHSQSCLLKEGFSCLSPNATVSLSVTELCTWELSTITQWLCKPLTVFNDLTNFFFNNKLIFQFEHRGVFSRIHYCHLIQWSDSYTPSLWWGPMDGQNHWTVSGIVTHSDMVCLQPHTSPSTKVTCWVWNRSLQVTQFKLEGPGLEGYIWMKLQMPSKPNVEWYGVVSTVLKYAWHTTCTGTCTNCENVNLIYI